MTWYEKYRAGLLGSLSTKLGTMSESFDDAVSEWHHSDSELELHEFLGLTWQQYRFVIRYPGMIVPDPVFAEAFYAGYNQGYRDAQKER